MLDEAGWFMNAEPQQQLNDRIWIADDNRRLLESFDPKLEAPVGIEAGGHHRYHRVDE